MCGKMIRESALITFIFLTLIIICKGQYVGEKCDLSGKNGTCVLLDQCKYALELLQAKKTPQHCGFEKNTPIVCCPKSENIKQACLWVEDTENRYGESVSELDNELITPTELNNGSIVTQSDNKPIVANSNDTIEIVTIEDIEEEVMGGSLTEPEEFAHMVALGYGKDDSLQYYCGGSLIHEKYVLTAAHCLYSPDLGEVKWIRLGDKNLNKTEDDYRVKMVRVRKSIQHPDYHPPSQYNDIALIELDTHIYSDQYIHPACLHTEYDLPKEELIATGWGRIGYTTDGDGELLKVDVTYFSHETCKKIYEDVPKRKLSQGISDETMLCAGGVNEQKDTCQGDSGGPLQVKINPSRYDIVGVTSFGKGCGINNVPGVYTRISKYYSWIRNTIENQS